jgi:DNA-directed RNA polymerase specialized sigma24 family protein
VPGPLPQYRPIFPDEFVAQAQRLARARSATVQLHQRARLVLLLHEFPSLSNVEAAALIDLHPNSIRLWRQRWAAGHFTFEDEKGRGRQPVFSPP